MKRFNPVVLVLGFGMLACGRSQDAASTPSADSTGVAPAVTDSATLRASDTSAKVPSAAKAAATGAAATKTAAPKTETGDYDQAIRPRFKIDEKTGKIDTIRIKKP